MTKQFDTVRAIVWKDDGLSLLDQRKLPAEEIWRHLPDAQSVADAIRDMVVRGAPAIGITAAYGVVTSSIVHQGLNDEDKRLAIKADIEILAQSRPTAVNLFWALDRMSKLLETSCQTEALLNEANKIYEDDIAANYHMGDLGASLIEADGKAVLTHCNTGSLATGGYGTALGVIRSAYTTQKISEVFADETRPWLQGARLTAWELVQDQIPVTLLCEGAAASLLASGKISWVIVGSDRIAANGDVANKIGTYSLAVNARYHGVKFMVVAPTTTVDMSTATGTQIPIEQRDPSEVLSCGQSVVASEGARAWNPAFDVTPAELVDAIITEKGIVENPTTEKMRQMMES